MLVSFDHRPVRITLNKNTIFSASRWPVSIKRHWMLGVGLAWCSARPIKRSHSVPASLKACCFQVNSEEAMAISHQEGDSDACPIPCHLVIGLLQLMAGRPSPEHHPPLHLIQNAISPSSPTSLWLSLATRIRFKTLILACKAKNRHLPPWRHSSNPALHYTSFKHLVWLKSTHHPSR